MQLPVLEKLNRCGTISAVFPSHNGELSPKIFLVVETTEYEGDPFLSFLLRMINKVIGLSCIRFTAIFPASNFNT